MVSRWKLYAKTSSRLLWFPKEDYHDLEVAKENKILSAGELHWVAMEKYKDYRIIGKWSYLQMGYVKS